MRENLSRIFHVVIITVSLLTLSGCGHKADPFYTPSTQDK